MNNIKILYLALLLIFTLPAAVQGQQLDHKLGEFIVQISEDYDERQAFKELKEIKNYGASLTVQRILVPDLRIYLLSVDFTKVNEIEMLRLLRQQKSIKLAQFNHLIEYRNTPNDPQFSSQWQYINDGSNGGTLNADFDADLAWDITTGGLSPNGDSIVICVIDEGFDTEHSDLQPNHWINHAEIPDNNIDDDGNGYVDDYEGWNSYTENDNMGLIKGHGTPVAGIVGAKGNNGIGVSGVNWDVELMLVVGGGEEALALAAYAYPYAARKRYNETAGKEGAFVVATNASWGIPSLREVDAPIWCAFYDSLGQEGILSMAATENRNIDVDAEGDLPANCSSEFLIAVTNMDRTGNKLNSAGFGATHIDLGAYGAQTFNITSSNGYGSFGGTSAATPHVAGTVGLLYAAPCPSFSSLALNDPRAAALLARQFLLDGVVPSPSLAGITVTGGGLNMYNSLQMLMDNCDPCPAPALFGASTVTDKEMILDWVETDSILSVDLQWRIQGSTEWSTVQDATMPYTLSNLSACTLYELQLRSFCNADTSDYSKLLVVETDGCCRPPSDLSISDRQAENVTANWSAVLAANSYNLRYRQTGTMDWSTQNTTAVNVLLSGLGSCSDYELQIQTVCDTGATAFSPSLFFSTLGCGACIDLEYCKSDGVDATGEWIQKVGVNGWSNESESNGGYGDFTGLTTTTLMANQSYQFIMVPGYSNQNWDEYVRAWIDFNQDGNFDDATELVYDTNGAIDAADTATIQIPAFALSGLTRMRVSMEFIGFTNENVPEACDDFIEFGEVEDYCITIEGADCPPVAQLSGSLITPSAATISWDEVSADHQYTLEYREANATDWISVDVDAGEYRIPGLQQCTQYEARVSTSCGMLTSSYSPVYNFNTTCPCFIPSGLDTVEVGIDYAMLFWGLSNNADDYVVRHRKVDEMDWIENTTSTDSINLDKLDSCSSYEFQVKANCLGNSSQYSSSFNFNTSCITSVDDPAAFAKLMVFPNPFIDRFNIRYSLGTGTTVSISLLDLQGRTIKQLSPGYLPQGEYEEQIVWPQLAAGVYLLRIATEQGVAVRKVVRQQF